MKIHKTVGTTAVPFGPDMHQIVCRLGLRPRPHWGSLQRSPRPPNHCLFVRYVSSRLRQLCAVWNFSEKHSSPAAKNIHRLQRMQNTLARVVLGSSASKFSHSADMLRYLHWLPVEYRIKFIPTKIHKTVAIRAAPFGPDMHQIVCRLGHRPRPHWGSLQRSPRPPNCIKGAYF